MQSAHFIGIGGIGMSALARHLLNLGFKVSGSDMNQSKITDNLEKEGIKIFIGHNEKNISQNLNLVVFSEAIPKENEELKKTNELRIKNQSYFAALGEFTKDLENTIIAGTHGKSTTTAMLSQILIENKKNPTVFLGTLSEALDGKNYRSGSKNTLIEACEYRENFLKLHPKNMLFLNAEPEHLDYFKTPENYYQAFWKLAPKVKKGGFLAANFDMLQVGSISARMAAEGNIEVVSYGEREGVDFRGEYMNSETLKIYEKEIFACEIKLQVPGWHNRQNALAAYVAARLFNIKTENIKSSLESFTGTWRRTEKKGEKEGVIVYDDYAHHPTEISASLSGLRELYPDKKIVCVFQPHQYSRTANFLKDFGKSLSGADKVIIPNIYEVRDSKEDKESVSAEKLVEEINKNKKIAENGESFEKTISILKNDLKNNEILITMGAGNVYKIAEKYLS